MSFNNTPTVSISDLVPLVVAVLKDQAVADENEELRQQLNDQINERLLVQVTGPNGTPVFYQASLKDGGTCSEDEYGYKAWMVHFGKKEDGTNNTDEDIVLPSHLINEIEIRMNGNFLFFLKESRMDIHVYDEDFNKEYINSNEPQMGGIHFKDNSSKIVVHGRIGPFRWSQYSEVSAPELIAFANDDTKLNVTAVVFNMDKLGDSIISLLDRMGTSTTCIHDESWVASVRSTGRPPSSTFFGDVRVGVKEIKSMLVLYSEDSSITFSNPLHQKQQLKLLLEMVDDPRFSYSLRDYYGISSLISVLSTVFVRNNVDDVGETNEESLKTINEILKNQRELVKDTFSVTMKVTTEQWVVKELLEHLTSESIFSDVFLEGIGGYSNNCNRNIIALGLFYAICKLLNTQPNIGYKYLNMSVKLLERLTKKIDVKVFVFEGAMTEVSRLVTKFFKSDNEDHKKISKILHHMAGTVVLGTNGKAPDLPSTEDSLQYKYCTMQN